MTEEKKKVEKKPTTKAKETKVKETKTKETKPHPKRYESKTKPTDVPVSEYLETVDKKRKEEAIKVIEIMKEIAKEEPVMWGPSIIGFGQDEYSSSSGCFGIIPKIGFSPRKANLTFYFYPGFHEMGSLLEKLGKHTLSVACLYVPKLEEIDLDILKEMLKITWKSSWMPPEEIKTAEDYIAAIPKEAKESFEDLRKTIKKILPESEEVLSYGILGFKTDKRRAKVYISGFKDHLGMYPVPKDESLLEELKPWIKGKGTLWLTKENPMSFDLIKRYVEKLVEEANAMVKTKSKSK